MNVKTAVLCIFLISTSLHPMLPSKKELVQWGNELLQEVVYHGASAGTVVMLDSVLGGCSDSVIKSVAALTGGIVLSSVGEAVQEAVREDTSFKIPSRCFASLYAGTFNGMGIALNPLKCLKDDKSASAPYILSYMARYIANTAGGQAFKRVWQPRIKRSCAD